MNKTWLLPFAIVALSICGAFIVAAIFIGAVPVLYFHVDWRFVFSLAALGWLLFGALCFKIGLK